MKVLIELMETLTVGETFIDVINQRRNETHCLINL